MLSPSIITEVRRLLAAGFHSQRAIARLLQISRGTVLAVARGRRMDRTAKTPSERRADYRALLPEQPAARCSECGARVYLPCVACRVRRKLAERSQRSLVALAHDPGRAA